MDYFNLKFHNTTVKSEIFAGIAMFMAMSYIVVVCPSVLSGTGMDYNGVFLATVLVSGFTTIVSAFFTKLPIALAPGLGMTSMFFALATGPKQIPWTHLLLATYAAGIIICAFIRFGLYNKIMDIMDVNFRRIIMSGIGFALFMYGISTVGLLEKKNSIYVLGKIDIIPLAICAISLLVIFVSALIGVVTIFFLPTILMWISTLFESETISIRFKELAIFMKGGEVSADGDMASRMTVYRKCFEYFFKSPIRVNVSVPFNTHSTFLGIMCDLGIVGMIPTFYISFTIHKRIYEIAGDCHIKKAFLPVYVLWVLLGLLNPVHAALPLNMVVWFLIPATMYFLTEKHKESSELKNDANG